MNYKHKIILLIIIASFLFHIGCISPTKTKYNDIDELTANEKQEIINSLNAVYESDQHVRANISSTIEKYGIKSPQVMEISKKMHSTDSLNIIVVKSLISKYGWISSKIVGEKANSAIFLAIQHSSDADREYFLPLMRVAVKNNSASAKDLALLEDRVAVSDGRKQIYGTQIGFDDKTNKYYVLPIDNPKKVDERRAKVGLSSMASYLSQWKIKWDTTKNTN